MVAFLLKNSTEQSLERIDWISFISLNMKKFVSVYDFFGLRALGQNLIRNSMIHCIFFIYGFDTLHHV